MPRKKASGADKRYPLNMRTTKEQRDRLERAARASGRSLIQEVDKRLEQSFKDDAITGDLADLHEVIRLYLRTLGKRKTLEDFDIHDPNVADGLRMGFDLIMDALVSGPLPEERIKKFFLKDQDDLLDERGGVIAVNIANDALNVLSAKHLATIDVFKVSQWMKDEAARSGKP